MRVQRQIDQLLAQRAAEWVDALKSGRREDHEAFLAWLRESKLHVEHYLETEALDRQLQVLGPTPHAEMDALLSRITRDAQVIQGSQVIQMERKEPAQRQPRRWSWRLAAAIAAIGGVAAAIWTGYAVTSSRNQVITAAGERRSVTLPDGSRVMVNAMSRLSIDYSSRERTIRLTSGEAVFDVAHDVRRPFIVQTPTTNIRALGTEFNVDQRHDGTALVSVIEGRVQVTTRSGDAEVEGIITPNIINLGAGEEAQVSRQRIQKRAHPDVSKTLGWREGRLYFDNTPLEEVAAEFNRYGGPMRLEVEGIEPGKLLFGGVFNASEPEVFVQILERQRDVEVVRNGGTVVIRYRHPPGDR